MTICRYCHGKQKWIFRKQKDLWNVTDKLKDGSKKDKVEITSTKQNEAEKEVTSKEEACQCHVEEPQMSQNKNKMCDSYFT